MPISVRLNKILVYAREEAERLHNAEVLPEHLLLGILRLEEGVGYTMLVKAGCVPQEAKEMIDDALREDKDVIETIQRSAAVERISRIANSIAREYNDEVTGSGHLLLAILREHINRAAAFLESNWHITYERAAALYPKRVETTRDASRTGEGVADDPADKKKQPTPHRSLRTNNGTPALDKYGHDLTLKAMDGELDPVVGREVEINRVIQILARRKKNNPILIGEPGVGKSAIVEGIAQAIIDHKSPLSDRRIITLDIASMVAGTTYRGQFEERMKSVIDELHKHPEIILFIDEIHTIIGAGNAQGSLDAANILKPALSRGEVQCIGATTTNEYRTSVEKDGALERRFQKVVIKPTSAEETLEILIRLSDKYASFHHVTYPEEALKACVTLAERYLTDRAFPDKAIDVMDEVGARIHTAGHHTTITLDDVAATVSMMSGVPVQRIRKAESERLRTMADTLQRKVIGQNEAVTMVVKAIQRSRLGLRDPKRPIGTFFFLGPTGVGKTYLAQCLAEEMFGSRDALIRFDMTEYMEKHTVSLLVGAPPGYVAHEDGGKLTEAVRRTPYSILLFDEIEKAHPDIFNILLQVLDEGRLTDRQGHQVDFKNTIIILTSNVGTRQLKDFGAGVGFEASTLDVKAQKTMLVKAMEKTFPPEFVNRIDSVITFNTLSDKSLETILDLEIDKLRKRLKTQGYKLKVGAAAKRKLLEASNTAKFGARPLKRAIQTMLEDKITEKILATKREIKTINIETL